MVLPVRGGDTISPRWPLPSGRQQVHDARADIFARGFQLQPLLRIQRRQVVEQNLVARLVGRLEIDRLDLDQREIFLALMRRPHLSADGVAGFQIELADLRGRHVNVVRPRQVVVVGRAQEAVAVREDLQHAFGEDVSFFFALRLQDLEDEVLFAESAGAGQLQGSGDLGQLGNVLFFQFSDGHIYLRGFDFLREGLSFSLAGMDCFAAVRAHGGAAYAARRCASAKFSGSLRMS
jgi:hypothetical protein